MVSHLLLFNANNKGACQYSKSDLDLVAELLNSGLQDGPISEGPAQSRNQTSSLTTL